MANRAVRCERDEFIGLLPLPPNTLERRALATNPFSTLNDADEMDEAQISERFTKAVNVGGLVPGLALSLSENRPDPVVVDETRQKIDAAFFRQEVAPRDRRPHWADQLVCVEFKRHVGFDPFDDDSKDGQFDADAQKRREARGQIITYAELVFAVQQRVALFMLLIVGRKFRLLRWDRAGTIVTRAIDYYENPDTLCDFLWRISHLSDEVLGLDPSALRIRRGDVDFGRMDIAGVANENDVDHMERALGEDELGKPFVFKYVRTMFRTSLQPEWPRYRIQVPNGDSKREFLIGKPVFQASGMAGRGTRGYVALDTKTRRFVWLKDAWRASYLLVDKEGDVLQKLNDAGIKNVPTLVCHGDILDQATITADWWERSHPLPSVPLLPSFLQSLASSSRTLAEPVSTGSLKRKRDHNDADNTLSSPSDTDASFRSDCPLRRHNHYRLVMEEVALPLRDFQYGRQLVSIIYDCLRAHHKAATTPDVQIFHRDISGGNILIYPRVKEAKGVRCLKWTGMLADWELSKPVRSPNEPSKARQPERTGTWQFMSVNLLSDSSKRVKVSDELESFFHVLLYYAARYLNSNCGDVAIFIDDFFDCYSVSGDRILCGSEKSKTMQYTGQLRCQVPDELLLFDSPMDYLLSGPLKWFKGHYAVMRHEAKLAARPLPAKRIPAPSSALPTFVESDDEDNTPRAPKEEKPKKEEYLPTPEDEGNAPKVAVHDFMLNYLRDSLKDPEWALDKAPEDRVPPNWESPRQVLPSMVSNKRARREGYPSHVASLPTHVATASTRRYPANSVIGRMRPRGKTGGL